MRDVVSYDASVWMWYFSRGRVAPWAKHVMLWGPESPLKVPEQDAVAPVMSLVT